MTRLLDAHALVALVLDEPAAGEVEALIRSGDSAVATLNLAEAVDVATRVKGLPAASVRATLEPLLGDVIAVRALDAGVAWRAAELRSRLYHRSRAPLSLADCVLMASAGPDDAIATADVPLIGAAQAEGVGVIGLPDSSGRRPAA